MAIDHESAGALALEYTQCDFYYWRTTEESLRGPTSGARCPAAETAEEIEESMPDELLSVGGRIVAVARNQVGRRSATTTDRTSETNVMRTMSRR